ncbi:hypothetical protein KBD49_14995 [Myxococcota bacterium]|nr:hypothetical protein [Myxococcota bacterium]
MRSVRWTVIATGLLPFLAGCPQKVPYPAVRKSPSQAQPPPGLADAAAATTKAEPARTAVEDPGAQEGPSWHGALLWTPEGTIRVKAGPGGKDLSSRLLAGQWIRVADGEVQGVRIQAETKKAHPKGKESRFVKLLWQGAGGRKEVSLDAWTERPDLGGAARADPDLAVEFFHRENLAPIGAEGPRLVLLLSVDGYLGGAHPYAVRRLLVVDVERGEWVGDRDPGEATRQAREALGDAWETACLRRPAGIAEVEGQGGRIHRILGLTHDVESCAGKFRAVEIGTGPLSEGSPGPDPEGRWILQEGLTVSPVADWRQVPGRRTVLLMGRDPKDRVIPVEKAFQPEAARELLWWEPGLERPVPVGRAPRLLEVQFLEELPREWSGATGTIPPVQKGSGGGGIGEGS